MISITVTLQPGNQNNSGGNSDKNNKNGNSEKYDIKARITDYPDLTTTLSSFSNENGLSIISGAYNFIIGDEEYPQISFAHIHSLIYYDVSIESEIDKFYLSSFLTKFYTSLSDDFGILVNFN